MDDVAIALDFGTLRRTAGQVTSVGEGVDEAAQAAMTTSGFDAAVAFGVLCNFMAPPAIAVTGMAAGAIKATGLLVSLTADNVRESAEDFERLEQDLVRGLKQLLGDLGEGGNF
jgi:hypothetical protein